MGTRAVKQEKERHLALVEWAKHKKKRKNRNPTFSRG